MSHEDKIARIKEYVLRQQAAFPADREEDGLCFVETLLALYHNVMNLRSEEPQWPERDRFVMSAWPYRAAYYAVLAQRGFFPFERLDEIAAAEEGRDYAGSCGLAGVDAVVSGAGEGLGLAVDMALEARADIKIYRSYVMISQADCLSGKLWESAIRASENMLEDLTVILCRRSGDILPGADNICAKFSAFGFDTFSVDGDNVDAVTLALLLPHRGGRPRFICCELK